MKERNRWKERSKTARGLLSRIPFPGNRIFPVKIREISRKNPGNFPSRAFVKIQNSRNSVLIKNFLIATEQSRPVFSVLFPGCSRATGPEKFGIATVWPIREVSHQSRLVLSHSTQARERRPLKTAVQIDRNRKELDRHSDIQIGLRRKKREDITIYLGHSQVNRLKERNKNIKMEIRGEIIRPWWPSGLRRYLKFKQRECFRSLARIPLRITTLLNKTQK